MNKIVKYGVGVLALLAGTSSLQAQNEVDAMDYRLQKWPDRYQFNSNKGSEHLFLSGSVGGNFTFNGKPFPKANRGVNANFYIGKWFTPIHGFRGGLHTQLLNNSEAKVKMFGISADYLLNISALSGGYNPDRIFEVYGTAGIGADLSFQKSWDDKEVVPSGYIGLQGNFRLSPIAKFFFEPRLQIARDNYDRKQHWRNYDAAFTLQAGFTYEILERSRRTPADDFERSPFGNNTFLSFGAGINQILSNNYTTHLGPEISIAAGKWFSPHSGLRLGASTGMSQAYNNPKKGRYHKFFQGKADYLLNLNNLCGYYRESPFELIGIAGVNYASASTYLTGGWHNAWGLGFGIQANLFVSKNTSLFLEPRITFFQKDFASGISTSKLDMLAELTAGFTMHAASRSVRRDMDKMDNSDYWNNHFIQIGAGMEMFVNPTSLTTGRQTGPSMQIAFGKWWKPRSGFRVGLDAGWSKDYRMKKNPRLYTGSLSLDYLWNITNALYGYNEERKLYLTANMGAVLTATAGNSNKKDLFPGVEIGLQGLWQMTPRFGLYIQPEARLYSHKIKPAYSINDKIALMGSVRAGIQVNMGTYDRAANHQLMQEKPAGFFLSGMAGSGSVTNRDIFGQAGTRMKLGFGKWYTPLSAFRVNVAAHWARTPSELNNYYAGIEPEYLFSLSTLYAGYNPDRVFNLNLLGGVSAGVSHQNGDNKFTAGVHAGLQTDFRILPKLHLFFEPRTGIYNKNYDSRKRSFTPTVELNAGLTIYFR